jgi:Asp/Glu/hydantoin racemase
MKEIKILIAGKHPDIMKVILRLINNKPNWNAIGAFTVEEALSHTEIDVVLLGAGLSKEESEQVKQHFSVPVVQHYGGGSGLLFAEIYQVIGA